MRYLTETIMSAADASTNESSSAVDARYLFAASIQAIVTGTAVGAIQLQASNDIPVGYPNATTQTPTHWSSIGSSVPVSAAGTYLIPRQDICYAWIRAIYTSTSDTGTITMNLKALGF